MYRCPPQGQEKGKKMVPKEGVEPSRGVASRDFESRASANSATSARHVVILPQMYEYRKTNPSFFVSKSLLHLG